MKEIEELVIENAGQSFAGNDFRMLCKPCVYMFLQQGTPIYIGATKRGIERIADPHHLQASRAQQECDEVRIWPCVSVIAARQLEKHMISVCKPKYNKRMIHTIDRKLLGLGTLTMTYPQASEGLRRR